MEWLERENAIWVAVGVLKEVGILLERFYPIPSTLIPNDPGIKNQVVETASAVQRSQNLVRRRD